MASGKTIVFFPEAAFGPALNSVGIAQACRALGHRPVFVADVSFDDEFAGAMAEAGRDPGCGFEIPAREDGGCRR